MTARILKLPAAETARRDATLAGYPPAALAARVAAAIGGEPARSALLDCLCDLASRKTPGLAVNRLLDAVSRPEGAFSEIDFENTMAELGFEAQRLRQPATRIDRRLLPCLIWLDERRPALLVADAAGEGLQVVDPAAEGGEPAPLDPEEARRRRRIVVFTPLGRDRIDDWRFARETRGRRWFQTQFLRFRTPLAIIVLLGFALNVMSMSAPVFILLIYDRVVGPQAAEPLFFLSLGAVLVVALEIGLRWARSLSIAWITSRLDFVVGVALFRKLLRLAPRTIEQSLVSNHMARIKSFEAVREFFAGAVFISALELPSVVLSFAVIYAVGGSLVVTVIVAAATYCAAFFLVQARVRGAMQEAAIESSRLQQFNIDTVGKLENIRSDGLSDLWLRKHGDLSARAALAQHRLFRLGVAAEQIGGALAGFTALSVLWFGAHLIWDGAMSAAALIAVVMLSWRALAPFHALCAMVPQFEQARNAIQQIDVFMENEALDEASANAAIAPALAGAVEFDAVALRYDAANGPVFMGLSLKAAPGEVIAISGANGAGKTSVLRLLLGFQRPLLGAVRLDGFDLRQIDGRTLRERIAYMPQHATLFTGTIADNLRVAAPLAEDEDLRRALERAGAGAQIDALADGVNTAVEARDARDTLGDLLLHRVCLARALLNPSKVLLLDEQPAAVLRGGFDEDLKRVIAEAGGTRTIFIVTHRADFVRMATKVLTLARGRTPRVGDADLFLEAS